MKIVRLGASFYNCPVPWQNMIHHLQLVTDNDQNVPIDLIESELAKYGGHYRHDFGRMEFETVAEYTMFVLKWA